MRTVEAATVAVAVAILAAGWFHGFTGHRTCRVLHMQMTGRTSDVSFQPTGWHPRDTKGHPRIQSGDSKGELEQQTCRRVLLATKAAVVILAAAMAASVYFNPAAATVALLAAEMGTAAVYMRYAHWRLHRIILIRPQASPLASVLSYHMRLGASDLAEGMRLSGDGVVEQIEVPSTYLSIDRNQDEVNAILRERLPLQQPEWHLEASYPFIDLPFRVNLPEPGDIRWSDLAEYIAACGRGEYVVGVDPEGVLTLSFRKFPHHAWSFASGRGKSTLLRAAIVQLLSQDPGNRVVCLDTKRVSLEPIAGIRGLTYLNDPSDIGAMCSAVHDVKLEMNARYEERGRRRFPLLTLVLEEAADLDDTVRVWWAERRKHDKSLPSVPPIWTDLVSILRQGREVDVNVILVTQDFDDRKYGGVGLRSNFELILMSGWRDQQWLKTIGSRPVPRPEDGAGRLVVCHGRNQIPVQAMTASPAELLDYARQAEEEVPR